MEVSVFLVLFFQPFLLTTIRNIGILFGYVVFFFCAYALAAEFARPPKTKGEVLVFRRGKVPSLFQKPGTDEESLGRGSPVVEKPNPSKPTAEQERNSRPSPSACGKPVFHWEDVCYDVKIKGDQRRILDHVDGWVQPGVTTALMVSPGELEFDRLQMC